VFGASDEILGALESGVDFERRVLDIYQSCRSNEEIGRAFDALREDLEHRIDRRMTEARSLLLERFDGDVRRRLRLAGEEVGQAVDRRRRSSRDSARSVLGHPARAPVVARAAGEVARAARRRALAAVTPRRCRRGWHVWPGEGWRFAYRFRPSRCLMSGCCTSSSSNRDGFRAPPEDAELLARVPAREGSPDRRSGLAAVDQNGRCWQPEVLREARRRSQAD
jgi:hypothetical protein